MHVQCLAVLFMSVLALILLLPDIVILNEIKWRRRFRLNPAKHKSLETLVNNMKCDVQSGPWMHKITTVYRD